MTPVESVASQTVDGGCPGPSGAPVASKFLLLLNQQEYSGDKVGEERFTYASSGSLCPKWCRQQMCPDRASLAARFDRVEDRGS